MKKFVLVCFVLAIATMALAGEPFIFSYRWVVGPASVVEKVTSPSSLMTTANNGWSLCEQLADSHIGRIHIVYTKSVGGASRVFTRYTDNRGRTWSDPRTISLSNFARDAAISCLGCTLAIAFSDSWDGKRHMWYAQDTEKG
jgi:hypothetical protein